MTSAIAAGVERLLRQARARWPMSGAAVSIVGSDVELVSATAGWADLASRRAVDQNTRFEIGSISKSFTAFALGQLADARRVDLHRPVAAYLPWFSVRTRYPPITLRHLMQHTSGLITGNDALPDALAHAYALRESETGSAPGELFHYSNTGYVLLGLVIEAVTGRRLSDVIAEQLLGPMGMDRSTARITHDDHARLATGYQPLHDDRLLLPGDPLVPATWFEVDAGDGNVAATAADLGRYARMLLGRGTLDGAEVVAGPRFEELTTDLAPDGEPSPHRSRYALGLNVEWIEGRRCLTHGGGMVGYATFLAVDLEAERAVVVLTNAPGECPVAQDVARAVLDLAVEDRQGGRRPSRPEIPDPTAIPDAEQYIGTYGSGQREITVELGLNGSLWLRSGGQTGRLYATGQDRLGCDHPDWRRYPHRISAPGRERRWLYGPYALTLQGSALPSDLDDAHDHPLVGRYRSFSPWYTSFRVTERDGSLHLIAVTGVEAHTDEPELVPLDGLVFRIGADPRLPERLAFGPIVDGAALWVDRDGCRYSRCSDS
jgi:D-alanyl-D-alanine carboxypeptidase